MGKLEALAPTETLNIQQTDVAKNIGAVTVFEALAEQTAMFSLDGLGRTTMQMNVDFDD
jgi:hypothetical protein